MRFADVKLSQLQPNDYNPNVMPDEVFQQLQDNIKREGLQRQLIVRESKNNAYVIVDGEHRYKALKLLHPNDDIDVPVIVISYDEERKFSERADTLKLNQIHGDSDEILLALIVRDLIKDLGIEEVSSRLGYTQPELESMNELISYTPAKFIVTQAERMAIQNSPEMINSREFNIELTPEEAQEFYQAKTAMEKKAGKGKTPVEAVIDLAKNYLESFKN